MFNVYMFEVLKEWKNTPSREEMQRRIFNWSLIAGVVVELEEYYVQSTMRKLTQIFKKWSITINFTKKKLTNGVFGRNFQTEGNC